jgi:hypothetical protein
MRCGFLGLAWPLVRVLFRAIGGTASAINAISLRRTEGGTSKNRNVRSAAARDRSRFDGRGCETFFGACRAACALMQREFWRPPYLSRAGGTSKYVAERSLRAGREVSLAARVPRKI